MELLLIVPRIMHHFLSSTQNIQTYLTDTPAHSCTYPITATSPTYNKYMPSSSTLEFLYIIFNLNCLFLFRSMTSNVLQLCLTILLSFHVFISDFFYSKLKQELDLNFYCFDMNNMI